MEANAVLEEAAQHKGLALMPYYPGVVIFRPRALMLDVARSLAERLGDGFQFAFESSGGFQDRGVVRGLLQQQRVDISRFAISRPPHQFVLAGHLSPDALDFEAWDPDPNNTGSISEAAKIEWRASVLKIHQVLAEAAGALLSYTNAHDDHYAGSPGLYEIGEIVERELQASGAAALRFILQNPFFFWILGLSKPAFGDALEESQAEIAKTFHVVVESPDVLILENRKDAPLLLSAP